MDVHEREELTVAAQMGQGGLAQTRERMNLGIVSHAPDAPVALPGDCIWESKEVQPEENGDIQD